MTQTILYEDQVEELQRRLEEAEDALRAIRSGQVDALVVSGAGGREQLFVLTGADQPYRVFLETMNEGAVTLLPAGAIAYSNSRFAEIVQTPLEQVIGARFAEFVPEDRREQYKAFLAQGQAGTCKVEFPILSRNGNVVWAELSLSPVVVEGVQEICLVVRDISEHRQATEKIRRINQELEERVRQRTFELEEANRELEAFTYTVSHDLRAPLRAISSYSAIIQADFGSQLSAEVQNQFERIRNRAEKMGNLINDLLSFSRLGRQELRKQTVMPTELVREALAGLAAEQEGRRIEITLGDLPVCLADPVLLEQVFVNLLSNALKFSRSREIARIEIGAVKIADLPPDHSTKEADSDATAYFVRDNGIGFNIRYAHKLFHIFERLHTDTEYEGTGAGLTIVDRIIKRHGGRVWTVAAVEQGATFYFTLDQHPKVGMPSPFAEIK